MPPMWLIRGITCSIILILRTLQIMAVKFGQVLNLEIEGQQVAVIITDVL